jgi:hypothetical protein
MKVFDHWPTDMRPKNRFAMYVLNDAPTWMTAIVIFAAIAMSIFMFERSGTQENVVPARTHEITQPPLLPPREPAKP